MKKIFTLLCSAIVGTSAFAQLAPNGDFESGNAKWAGSNTSIVASINVTTSGGGQEKLMPAGGAAFAMMQNTTTIGVISQKFAFASRPKSFRYMYCYLPAGNGEAALAFIRLTKYNSTTMKVDTILAQGVLMQGGVYPWKEVILDLDDTKYKSTATPDTAYIQFATSVTANRYTNTALTLDNIKFSNNSASVKEVANSNNSLVGTPSISPNPVKEKAVINYQINSNTDVTIELYDMAGKMVKEIANEKGLNYGKYSAEFDASEITPGVYFYKISTGAYSTTQKIIISN